MVKKTNIEGKIVFKCEECSLNYNDKKWDEKCEGWCKKHNTCSLDITKHALKSK